MVLLKNAVLVCCFALLLSACGGAENATNSEADTALGAEPGPDPVSPDPVSPDPIAPIQASVTLTWDMPQSRENSTALTADDIRGYEVSAYNPATNERIIEEVKSLSLLVENLSKGLWEFEVVAIDSTGIRGSVSYLSKQIN
ncbi:MAG: hypothetical protein KUG82_16185 [Pseudomonadales bacterium]|nr:hypothetical protein [Pseudomonadales bacterium]